MILTAQNFRVYTHTHTHIHSPSRCPREGQTAAPGGCANTRVFVFCEKDHRNSISRRSYTKGSRRSHWRWHHGVRNQVSSYKDSDDKKKWSYPQTKGSKALLDDELLAEILTTLDKKQWLRNCETPAQFIEQIRDHVNLRNKIAGKPELDPDWMPSQSWMNTVMAECNLTKNKAQVANAARKDATESVRNFLSNYCA